MSMADAMARIAALKNKGKSNEQQTVAPAPAPEVAGGARSKKRPAGTPGDGVGASTASAPSAEPAAPAAKARTRRSTQQPVAAREGVVEPAAALSQQDLDAWKRALLTFPMPEPTQLEGAYNRVPPTIVNDLLTGQWMAIITLRPYIGPTGTRPADYPAIVLVHGKDSVDAVALESFYSTLEKLVGR